MTGLLVGLRDGRQAAGDRAGFAPLGQVSDVERDGRRLSRQGLELATGTPGREIIPVGPVGGQRVRGLGLRPVVPGTLGGRLDLGGDLCRCRFSNFLRLSTAKIAVFSELLSRLSHIS
jgi:hypothetical protein